MLRRLSTDKVKRSKSDILHYFLKYVEPMHQQYIERSKKNATLILKNNYKPDQESQKFTSYDTTSLISIDHPITIQTIKNI